MFSSSSKNKEGDNSLIIEIQSDLVRAAIVAFHNTDKPHIIYSSSQHIYYESKIEGARLMDLMINAIADIGNKIIVDKMKNIKSVHYVFSSPWVIPQSKTVKMDYDNEIEIKDSVILNIINAERKNLTEKFRKDEMNKEYEFDIAFIEENIFDVKLNGYSVSDYRGKRAKSLEVSFATTMSSYKILKKIDSIVKEILGIKKVYYHSALLLRYTALRELIDNRDEYISLHIHGELTDIVAVKRNLSSHLASFPIGRTTISRELSQAMKSTMKTSDSSISMYEDAKLEKSEEQKVLKNLLPIVDSWKSQFMKTLYDMNDNKFIPRAVYLSTHNHFKLFKNALESEHFEVIAFDDTFLDNSVVFEGSLEKNSLIGIYAFALNGVV